MSASRSAGFVSRRLNRHAPTTNVPSQPQAKATAVELRPHGDRDNRRRRLFVSLRSRLIASDLVSVAVAWVIMHVAGPRGAASQRALVVALVVVCAFTLAAFNVLRLYRARVASVRVYELSALARVAALTSVVAFMIDPMAFRDRGLPWYVLGGMLMFVLTATSRAFYSRWIRYRRAQGSFRRRVVIVGDGEEACSLAELLVESPECGFEASGFVGRRDAEPVVGLPWLGDPDVTTRVVRDIDATGVILTRSLPPAALNRLVRDLHRDGVHVHLSSGLLGLHHRRLWIAPIAYQPLLYVEPASLSRTQQVLKRGLDLLVASGVGVLTLPLAGCVALAIKASGGPVLFRQIRVGQNGREFVVLKFRTMTVDAEARLGELVLRNSRQGPLFKVPDDPRVTRLGRFLRAASIDELPQLVNVLRGEMSMVGPRPALPQEIASFDAELNARLDVRPGITGLWQVEARDNPSFSLYRRHDLFYVENWSLALDVAIMCRTAASVVGRAVMALFGLLGRGGDRRGLQSS